MKRSTDRILTTHAGSLPRPDHLTEVMFSIIEGQSVDEVALQSEVATAIKDVVARQREVGIDVISDGEMGKVGFSSYVLDRFEGFDRAGTHAVPTADDVADLGEAGAAAIFANNPGAAHAETPVLDGPIESRGPEDLQAEIEMFSAALGPIDPDEAFISSITPGQLAFNFPTTYYKSHAEYIEAGAAALKPEYKAIVDAGFNLQLDSPDSAMAFHFWYTGGLNLGDPKHHLASSIEVLNDALAGLPPEKLRYHVCWGNYPGPHHRDVPLSDIVSDVLRANVGFIYIEAANPRHEHEWEVWRDVKLPDDKALIVGVVDTKTNIVEHPELIAQRLLRFTDLVGKERVIAATDCGFATFVGMHFIHPTIAWRKLEALAQGAELASKRLASRRSAVTAA